MLDPIATGVLPCCGTFMSAGMRAILSLVSRAPRPSASSVERLRFREDRRVDEAREIGAAARGAVLLRRHPLFFFGDQVQQIRRDAEREAVVLPAARSEEHTSELQSHVNLVCR